MFVDIMNIDCRVGYYGSSSISIVTFDFDTGQSKKEMLYGDGKIDGFAKMIIDRILEDTPAQVFFDTEGIGTDVKSTVYNRIKEIDHILSIDSSGKLDWIE